MRDNLFVINPGEIWAIVGDSESGHSELLSSLYDKDAELVSLRHDFRNLSHTTDFYYQQRFNSSDSGDALTVAEHLAAQPSAQGFWTVESVVQKFRLTSLLDEQVIKLSNGETKRVLIASALVRNPKRLLLDHPMTGLDSATRRAFDELLKDICSSGTSVINACGIADIPGTVSHVIAMKSGQVVYHGPRDKFPIATFDTSTPPVIDESRLKELVVLRHAHRFQVIVKMRNVNIVYGGKKILDNINWEVRQGERWSLSGPNGAGKSTLLSLINGDNPQAYANDILLFDRQRGSGESIWDIKRQTGFVSPELYQYFPVGSSCLQVIESGFYDTVGLFRPSDELKVEVCEKWMSLMQLDKYRRTMLSQAPPSVQRLVLLARALVKAPTLLILDEPTQGLDHAQQLFFTELIEQICRLSDVTVIYVSHYREHIPPAVTKHIALKEGRIESMG